MHRPRPAGPLRAVLLLAGLTPFAGAQAAYEPPPFLAIENVRLAADDDETRSTLVLRDGRVRAVLEAGAATPPGAVAVDGSDWIALPAFIDAYTTVGVETPEPVIDRDDPLDARADVRIDMRLANRKGIQPAFDAVEVATLDDERLAAYREAGFGAALQAPSRELLGGDSVLVTLRDAALRDRVLRPEVFAHMAFRASGGGYPSTLMGYIAQLRQFFHDAARHGELLARAAQGRPGPRPPFDADLEVGVALLGGERVVMAEAEGKRDIQRFLRIAVEMGFRVGIVGGRSAHEVLELLLEARTPLVLTLDFGREPDDPRPDHEEEPESGDADEGGEAEEAPAEEDPDLPEQQVDAEEQGTPDRPRGGDDDDEDEDDDEDAEDAGDLDRYVYREPYSVRLARRLEWEERRDGALRLAEAGLPFALGTDGESPAELLDRLRGLVERGLPHRTALEALTAVPARMLGVEDRLGRIAAGADATLVLWTGDPLLDEDARPAWVFVDGYGWENPEMEDDR